MLKLKNYEFGFVTGSQPIYGSEVIDQVYDNTKVIVDGLNAKIYLIKLYLKQLLLILNLLEKYITMQIMMKIVLV